MKIYFVRHGHPDYKNDCLTPLGKKQAEAAAKRLLGCGIERIYASTKGRAMETARYSADLLDLDIIPCDFMRELNWKSIDGEPILADGSPWLVAKELIAEGVSVFDADWQEKEPYCKSRVVGAVGTVVEGIDSLLEELGYKREGNYYRVLDGIANDKTVAIFSHGGSSSAVLSHMLHIPFAQFCATFHIDFTSVTIVEITGEVGKLTCPKLLLFDDAKHIEGITVENFYGN